GARRRVGPRRPRQDRLRAGPARAAHLRLQRRRRLALEALPAPAGTAPRAARLLRLPRRLDLRVDGGGREPRGRDARRLPPALPRQPRAAARRARRGAAAGDLRPIRALLGLRQPRAGPLAGRPDRATLLPRRPPRGRRPAGLREPDAEPSGTTPPARPARRRAAAKHQPGRAGASGAPPRGAVPDRFYYAQQWGADAILVVVDDRSYRGVRLRTSDEPEADSPDRTMLGP